MDLGKIVRDGEDRDVRDGGWGAVVLAVLTVVQGAIAWSRWGTDPGIVLVSIGVAQLSMAIGIFRGSRACAIGILALFLADRALLAWTAGWASLVNIWTLAMLATLYAGVQGTFAQHARRASVRPRGTAA